MPENNQLGKQNASKKASLMKEWLGWSKRSTDY